MTHHVTGLITRFTAVLGLQQGDDKILDALDEVATPFEVDEFADLGEEYWSFNGRGVEILFTEQTLTSIFFHIEPEDDDPELGTWDDPLIEGLPLRCTVEQARGTLGEPQASGEGDHGPWHRFALDHADLHLDFTGSTCALVTAMQRSRVSDHR